jgi:molybdate transport system ATP-binding protein
MVEGSLIAMADTGLQATVVVRRGGFTLDLDLEVEPGQTVALLGPNGAGKSTTVAALAGLVPIDEGRIVLDGSVLDDPRRSVHVPAEDRRVGVVFQDYVLFPHFTVLENVAFSARATGEGRIRSRALAHEWVERLGLQAVADRRPSGLSGGQAQRVAMARALASRPRLLLLDEPLSALDVTGRGQTRRLLAGHLADFAGPRLLITHDATEAFLLADVIHVIENGVVSQVGTADQIRLRPRTAYVADLAGANLLQGLASRGSVEVDGATIQIADRGLEGKVLVTIHPRAIALHNARPEGSPRNSWQTVIGLVENLGDRSRVQLGPPLALTAEITSDAARTMGLVPETPVWVSIKATEIGVEPTDGPDRV